MNLKSIRYSSQGTSAFLCYPDTDSGSAVDIDHSARSENYAKLLSESSELLLVGMNLLCAHTPLRLTLQSGIYLAFAGMSFDSRDKTTALEDFGPREYLRNFHPLSPYVVLSRLNLDEKHVGPVTTFGDPEFGFAQAAMQAELDLSIGRVAGAVVLGLRGPKHSSAPSISSGQSLEEIFAGGFVSQNLEWLKKLNSFASELNMQPSSLDRVFRKILRADHVD